MYVRKMSLPRRTFLRGMGTAVALPLLDAMVPSFTALAKTAANPQKRFGAVYIPHGAIMERYTPAKHGLRLRLHAHPEAARAVQGKRGRRQQPGSSRDRRQPRHRVGRLAERRDRQEDRRAGLPAAARRSIRSSPKQIGGDTPFPSIEVATENLDGYVGGCSPGYACAYMNTISWTSETSPVPMEINPARRVRAPVRAPRHLRAADGAREAGRQHPRLGDRGSRRSRARPRARATRPDSTSTSRTSARSSSASSAPKRATRETRRCRSTRRLGSPSRIRTTSACCSTSWRWPTRPI